MIDGTLLTINREDGREMQSQKLPVPAVRAGRFSRDCQTVAVTDHNGAGHVLDLRQVGQWVEQEATLPALQATLRNRPEDRKALAELGRWCAARGSTGWGLALLKRAQAAGADVSGDLATAYALRDDFTSGDWRAESRALDQSGDAKAFLARCRAVPDSLLDVLPKAGADRRVTVSPDGKSLLLSGARSRVARLLVKNDRLLRLPVTQYAGGPVPLANDGRTGLMASGRGEVVLLDLAMRDSVAVRWSALSHLKGEAIRATALSGDGKTKVVGYESG